MKNLLAWLAISMLPACSKVTSGGVNQETSMVTKEASGCRALLTSCGDDLYCLGFELQNQGSTGIEISTFEPFLAFTIMATADGKPLTVHQPALDVPSRPKTIRLPPKVTVTLQTPIRLRIAKDAKPGSDGFIWTIAHPKEKVSLQIKLNLPEPFGISCPVAFSRD